MKESENTIPPCLFDPTFFQHSLFVSPIDIFVLQFVGYFELGTSDLHDAMYISDVKEMACTNVICNKRISCAGQK